MANKQNNQPSKETMKLLLTLVRPIAEKRQREMEEKKNKES
jgi:hypothetical protein